MGAPSDTLLQSFLRVNLSTQYKRSDLPLNLTNSKDDLSFNDISHILTNGRGKDKANLQHYSRRRLINATEVIDIDGGLTNVWGHTLNYDAVKQLLIYNRETALDRYLEVTFKNERYYIGPQGYRVAGEPYHGGIEAITSSGSAEEGALTIASNADISFDLIVIGSSGESSSSSGP
jgi:hypothetical protein